VNDGKGVGEGDGPGESCGYTVSRKGALGYLDPSLLVVFRAKYFERYYGEGNSLIVGPKLHIVVGM